MEAGAVSRLSAPRKGSRRAEVGKGKVVGGKGKVKRHNRRTDAKEQEMGRNGTRRARDRSATDCDCLPTRTPGVRGVVTDEHGSGVLGMIIFLSICWMTGEPGRRRVAFDVGCWLAALSQSSRPTCTATSRGLLHARRQDSVISAPGRTFSRGLLTRALRSGKTRRSFAASFTSPEWAHLVDQAV